MPATRVAEPDGLAHLSPPTRAELWSPTAGLWSPQFPSPDGLDLAVRMFDARPAWAGEEGPRPRLLVSAGAFAVEAPDLARRARRHERAEQARRTAADIAATYILRGEDLPETDPSREILGLSSKARANMVRALCEIDYRPMLSDPTRLPAMVTLTYPTDWLTVAPNGKAAKRHLKAFRKRFIRAWGVDLLAIWKLEFQRRGAPHFHLLMVPPHGCARRPGPRARRDAWVGAELPFKQWLSAVWADIVAHPDPTERERHEGAGTNVSFAEGLRASDPKRVSVYFTKHGAFRAKEYQHCVPKEWQAPGQGPGRFWGYWGLERVTVAVEVAPQQATRAARIVRRWARAQGTTREVSVPRTRGGRAQPVHAEVEGLAGAQLVQAQAPTRYRSVRRRVRRLGSGRGFVSVNNGQTFAVQLARALSIWGAESVNQ